MIPNMFQKIFLFGKVITNLRIHICEKKYLFYNKNVILSILLIHLQLTQISQFLFLHTTY